MRANSAITQISTNQIGRIAIPQAERPYRNRGWIVAARAFWPKKTAYHWSAEAHVTERMARFWLSGRYEPSADGLKVVSGKIYEDLH